MEPHALFLTLSSSRSLPHALFLTLSFSRSHSRLRFTHHDSITMTLENARAHAAHIAQRLRGVHAGFSPVSEIATVADATGLLERGSITASTQHGPIQVLGVPFNSVCPGMQIMVHRQFSAGPPVYLYDGPLNATRFSSAYSGSSASLTVNTYSAATWRVSAPGGSHGLGLVTGSTNPTNSFPTCPSTGFFLAFFFYLSALPRSLQTPTVLVELSTIDDSGNVYGRLQIQSDLRGRLVSSTAGSWGAGGNYSSTTTHSFGPHRIWWLVAQVGNGLAVNGIQQTGDDWTPWKTSGVTPIAGSHYVLSFLGASDLTAAAPNGSWISKFAMGVSTTAGGAVLWPTAVQVNPTDSSTAFVPAQDSDIPNGSAPLGTGMSVFDRYLISDRSSSVSCPDSATYGSTLGLVNFDTFTFNGPY